MKIFYPFLNNQEFKSQKTYKIKSPENNNIVGEIGLVSRRDLPKFFESAHNAFKTFQDSSFATRKKILLEWRDSIKKNSKTIVNLIIESISKSKLEAQKEVNDALLFIEEIISFMYFKQPRFFDCTKSQINKLAYYQRKPYGVVLCINPFNYPVSSCMFKLAPALITGNTVVFKSATQTALIVSFLFKLLSKTSIPEGVASFIVSKGSDLGDSLVTDPRIKVINFTGSTKVGLNIKKINNWAKLLLELGGNDIGIVLKDCNLEHTVKQIIIGAFRYNGQRCTAIKRLIIEDEIYDRCLKSLKKAVTNLKIGRAIDNNDITAMINNSAINWAKKLVSDAISQGAVIETGNIIQNNVFHPTIVSGVTADMSLFTEEQFAPILPIYRAKKNESYHSFIKIANDSQYGLQGSIFTQDIDHAMYLANRVETGTVNINCSPAKGPNYLPFFGIKNSGCGSQGYEDVLNLYTFEKGIIINYE